MEDLAETPCSSLNHVEIYETMTLELTSVTYDVGINLTMPFDIWYALNKNRIKYYSPPSF